MMGYVEGASNAEDLEKNICYVSVQIKDLQGKLRPYSKAEVCQKCEKKRICRGACPILGRYKWKIAKELDELQLIYDRDLAVLSKLWQMTEGQVLMVIRRTRMLE